MKPDPGDAYFEMSEPHHFAEMAMEDYVNFIYEIDENKARKLLASIGNEARWLQLNGNLEMKLAFVENVCDQFEPLIREWAEERAEIARERGNGRA